MLQRIPRHPRAELLDRVLRRPYHQADLQAAQPDIYRVIAVAETRGKLPGYFEPIGSPATVEWEIESITASA